MYSGSVFSVHDYVLPCISNQGYIVAFLPKAPPEAMLKSYGTPMALHRSYGNSSRHFPLRTKTVLFCVLVAARQGPQALNLILRTAFTLFKSSAEKSLQDVFKERLVFVVERFIACERFEADYILIALNKTCCLHRHFRGALYSVLYQASS